MIRGGTDEAVHDQVVEGERQPAGLEGNLDSVCRGRLGLGDSQHAHCDKRAILAVIALLAVRAARHVAGHRCHIGHLGGSQTLRRCRRYQRSSDQADDHEDRQ